MSKTYTSLRKTDKKVLLSIDGGGVRGVLSLQFLREIEKIAEEISGDSDIRLCDCFDYIGGTSTGGIVASCLAFGLRVEEIEKFYEGAASMFVKSKFYNLLNSRYDGKPLAKQLQDVFGADTTLKSPKFRTLLMLVMLNATTSSPWPISSNPKAIYNDLQIRGKNSNLHFPVWQLVRASTAAPYFFPPETIEIEGKQHVFFDGALTSYNNPAFKLFQMATMPKYNLSWDTGCDKMLLVSVGTGEIQNSLTSEEISRFVQMLETVPVALNALMCSQTAEQDLLCRSFGSVRWGGEVDGEVGSLIGDSPIGGQSLFSYCRYNTKLSTATLESMGLAAKYSSRLFAMDSVDSVAPCREIGKIAASEQVKRSHFSGFWES